MATLEPELDHPAYHRRVHVRGYNYAITIFQAHSDRDAARILRRNNPDWTAQDHLDLAAKHAQAQHRQRAAWKLVANAAALETYGRPYQFWDYKISGIASEDFSETAKARLRFAAHAETYHMLASRAHAFAAKRASRPIPTHALAA